MFAYTALTTIFALLAYFYVGFRVGAARAKFGVAPPATIGNPGFERIFRAHQNMLEWMPIFLPALWLFAIYVSDRWAAVLGIVWILGRLFYAHGYAAEAEKRIVGFYVQTTVCGTLIIGATVGIVRALLL